MAGLMPAGVLAEVVNDDGSMARQPDLERFAEHHGLTLISEADLIACRTAHETLVRHLAEARLPTPFGAFAAHVFAAGPDGTQHLALVRGEPRRPRRRWSGSPRNV
jgi:3,4-dihydroxy 2-butanone 4-phosphate synthase/GTP cyclohydrolase II